MRRVDAGGVWKTAHVTLSIGRGGRDCMIRSCLFCGKEFRGQKKNREHIISDWLVDEADLRKRTMTVNIGARTLEVAMQRIVADSCEDCNSSLSGLEGRTKTAVLKIKNGLCLLENDGQTLLDWLDKVRTGLWLWSLQVGRGQYKITPKFNIDARIGRKDRIVLVAKYPEQTTMKGLAFWGVGESFLYMPSVLGLLINNIALVSLSIDFLLLRHICHIRPEWSMNDKFLQEVDIKKLDQSEHAPRLRILGSPYIFGQCIAPPAVMADLQILNSSRQSMRHSILRETSVKRLDSALQFVDGPLGIIQTSANVDINLILMEMNVPKAIDFMLRDHLAADFTKVSDNAKVKRNIERYNEFVSVERSYMDILKAKYEGLTGLRLPSD
jgi:hypothetical protein